MSAGLVLLLRALFALSLFAFLGWISYVLWKDLKQTIKRNSDYQILPIYVKLPVSNLSYSFDQPEFFIGRDPQADLQIVDDTLSAIHARIFYKNGQWMVEDLQSTNGTYLNEERLSTPSVLVAGDEITCGKVLMMIAFQPD